MKLLLTARKNLRLLISEFIVASVFFCLNYFCLPEIWQLSMDISENNIVLMFLGIAGGIVFLTFMYFYYLYARYVKKPV